MRPLVISDLDGTLALIDHRRPLLPNWQAFYAACDQDAPNNPVIATWNALQNQYCRTHDFWILSGRSDEVQGKTEAWLRQYHIYYDRLLMRQEGDFTPDQELKRAWIEPHVDRVTLVLDDRDKVVRMWRELGITCFQVAEGDF